MTTDRTSEERIANLETQITKLQKAQNDLYAQLTKAQLEQWQGRIDDLEVQAHLGAMEANERVTALVDQLRSKWAAARSQVEGATSTTTEVVDTLRIGLQDAFGDLRKALLQTKQKVTH